MVPNGWKVKSPTCLFKLFSGFAFKSTDAQESGTKWLKIANVGIGEIKWDADSFLPEHFLLEHKKFALSKGDIVVALTRPTLGNKLKVARLTKESDTSLLNQRVAKIVCKEDADSEFVFQLLRSDEFAYRINVGLLGTDPPNLSVKVLEDFTVGCPPIPEQRKIAKILSTWDKAISTTEKLIGTSKQQKKALMQQLLTGKKRLVNPETGKAFEGEWEEVKAGDIFSTRSNKKHNSDLPILAITQDQGAIPRDLIDYNVSVTKESVASYKVVEQGDFIISLRSFQGGIEYSRYKGICSPAYVILYPKIKIIDDFYLYHLKSHPFIQAMKSKLEGIRDGKIISYKYFSEIKLPVPSIEEQQKIASVLTTTVKETEALQAKLDHLKQEKKALMQQLLTGKRRVKVDEEVAA